MIDVRIRLPLNILRNSGLLLHAKQCSGVIVRFSDNSSCICLPLMILLFLLEINVDAVACDREVVWQSQNMWRILGYMQGRLLVSHHLKISLLLSPFNDLLISIGD